MVSQLGRMICFGYLYISTGTDIDIIFGPTYGSADSLT